MSCEYLVLLLDSLNLLIVPLLMNWSLLWERAGHESAITAEFALVLLAFDLLLLEIVN